MEINVEELETLSNSVKQLLISLYSLLVMMGVLASESCGGWHIGLLSSYLASQCWSELF